MSTETDTAWSTDLSARSAPRVSYAYVGRDERTWTARGDGTEVSDLGAAEATDGRLGVYDVRSGDAEVQLAWRAHAGDFLTIYVRSGSAVVESREDDRVILNTGDNVYLPTGYQHRLRLAPDTTLIEVASPAVLSYHEIGAEPAESVAAPIVNRDIPENYSTDGGPLSRSFFRYRDLGVSEASGGRIMLEVLAAAEPADRTGWHTHSMGQVAIILTGRAMIQVEEHPPIALEAGATACIGSRMRHDVYDVDSDYSLLEVYMPADWDTIPCPAPKNPAAR